MKIEYTVQIWNEKDRFVAHAMPLDIIPAYKQVPVSIIQNNLKTAGISRDEYFRLLEQKR
ncbi:MAG: hypothetical protein ACRD1N_10725 [Terriglobia bacterium]